MGLQVIGAGYGRTGTDSLRQALNMLGTGPCHHMHEVMPSADQLRYWDEKSRGQSIGWDTIFDGFSAAVDWPSAAYWEELMGVYPQARVILTWRSPESWWKSYAQTILPVLHRFRDDPERAFAYRIVAEGEFGGDFEDRDICIARYNANVDRVREVVPEDRLLIMELGEGWDRLCAFLGAARPDAPYPSGNTTTDFRTNLKLDEPEG